MTLGEMQQNFTQMVAKLIEFAYASGYGLTFGEAYRTPEQAALDAQKGIGIAASLHTQRLAVDFNLFKDGVLLTTTADYEPLGVFWESLGGSWGGRFMKLVNGVEVANPDSDHFSLAFDGRK